MPPRSVTIDIRDAAQQKIKASAAILSDRFGIAFPGAVGFEGRDLDYLRARELESIAGFMDALANEPESDKTKTLKVKLAQAEKQIENLTGEAVLLRAEIENLTAAWQEAETKLAAESLPTSADAVPELRFQPDMVIEAGDTVVSPEPVVLSPESFADPQGDSKPAGKSKTK